MAAMPDDMMGEFTGGYTTADGYRNSRSSRSSSKRLTSG